MSSATYRAAIQSYVSLLTQNGMVIVLDLQWSAPGTQASTSLAPMPVADHSPNFWASVATAFAANPNVIFDLFNEPYPDSNQDTTAAWTCLRNGGTCPGITYQTVGMQSLVNTVRATGATNVIMSPGVQYTNVLTHRLDYRPTDSLNNLAASWHSYAGQVCAAQSCWDGYIAPVAASVPLIAGEIGENDCADGYVNALIPWLDWHNGSYLGWAWDTYDCSSFPSLISSYDGTPTSYGLGIENHLQQLAGQPSTSTPTQTSTATLTPTQTRTLASTATSTPTVTATPPSATATPTACKLAKSRGQLRCPLRADP
jgi:hypothetical protein